MGVLAVESESTSAIAPARLFKALILDSDNLIPKILPQAIKSIEIVSGDGGAGTIKKIHFGEASQFKHVVHKIDAVDSENFTYSYSVIEGDVLGDLLEKISYDTKIVAGPNGGSIVKNASTYYIKGDNQLTEDQVKEGKEKASGLFKAVEAYLVANPDAYN